MTADFGAQPQGRQVDLAQSPAFDLGGLHVDPPRRRVTFEGRSSELEPRVMSVLVVLAAARPEVVSREQLVETCWEGRIVGDDAVNRCILALRNLARSHAPAPFRIETIRGVGFSLVTAPAELGPSKSRRPPTRSRVLIGASVIVATALIGFAGWRATVAPPSLPRDRVEAVRFEALRPDPESQRIAQALGASIVRILTESGIDTAQTPGRSGAPAAGEFRIAGAVDEDGQTYAVQPQILSAGTGRVLWSGRYERGADALAGFQEEVANRTVDVLHCALTSRRASNRRIDEPLFAEFLNACAQRRSTVADPLRYVEVARRLTELAPGHSVAHSMLAVAHGVAALEAPLMSPESARSRDLAFSSARRALSLDPKNGEAHFGIGIALLSRRDWLEAERSFLRAEELSPDLSVVRNYRVNILRWVGRNRDALALNERTVATDPFSTFQPYNLAVELAAIGEMERTEQVLKGLELINPASARAARLKIALWSLPPAEGRRALLALAAQPAPFGPGGKGQLAQNMACYSAYLARLQATHGQLLRGLPAQCEGIGRDRMRFLAREGDFDGAYAAAQADDLGYNSDMLFGPDMQAFRRDGRFMPLARRMGLVSYWSRSGHWPDFCSDPQLPYDCRAAARAAHQDAGPAQVKLGE